MVLSSYFGSACIDLFCFGVIGNRCDPSLDVFASMISLGNHTSMFCAQYATLSECAVSRNCVLKLV